jgi:DNA-binding NarL/FixJ family response regulator
MDSAMYDTTVTPTDLKAIVADPDPLARSALADMLRDATGVVVAAQAATAVEAAELVNHYAPDVLVVEASMAAADDFSLLRRVRESSPDVGLVLLAADHDQDLVMEALQLGATGIVTKHASGERIRDALRAVHRGQAALAPAAAMALIQRLRHLPPPGRGFRPIRSPLTNREWEILDLLVIGSSTREIAEQLVLTEDTVYSHVKSILRKLNASSRAEAVEAARRLYDVSLAAA